MTQEWEMTEGLRGDGPAWGGTEAIILGRHSASANIFVPQGWTSILDLRRDEL